VEAVMSTRSSTINLLTLKNLQRRVFSGQKHSLSYLPITMMLPERTVW
jgi:hypothetical protein